MKKDTDAVKKQIAESTGFSHSAPTIYGRVLQLLYTSGDSEKTIGLILKELGEFYGVSRAYIFEDSDDHTHCSNTFEWCADGVEPQIDLLQNLSYADDIGEYKALFDSNGVFFCPDVSKLPDNLRAILDPQGIKSMLHCAIMADGVFCGYVGFDDCTGCNTINYEQAVTLSLVAAMLGSVLLRRREHSKVAFSADFGTAIANNNAYIYMIDPTTYEVIYCNKTITDNFPRDYIGCSCYGEFMGRTERCPNCPAAMLLSQGSSTPMEFRRPDGIWLIVQASSLHWHGREVIMLTCTDITRQKAAEQELAVRNSEYAIVVKQSGKSVLRYDIATRRCTSYFDLDKKYDGIAAAADFPNSIISSGAISPESIDDFRKFIFDMEQGVPSGSVDIKLDFPNGETRWHHADYTLVTDSCGKPSHSIISFFDNTEMREKELSYRTWQDSLTALLADNAMYLEINLTKNLIEREENLGPENETRKGGTLTDFVIHGEKYITWHDDIPAFREFFNRERLLGLFYSGTMRDSLEYRAIIGGRPNWYRADLQMVKYPYSDEVKAFVVYNNTNEQRSEIERLSAAASMDALTRVANRSSVISSVTARLANCRETDTVAFFMIDIDNFKQVNDKLGHQQGDAALVHVAEAISDLFRAGDTVGRIGGDEFVVFMSSATPASIRKKAAELVTALQFNVDEIILTASIGVAFAKARGTSFDVLYNRADRALYEAKREGKNTYAIIDADKEAFLQESGDSDRISETLQLQTLLQFIDGGVIIVEQRGDEMHVIYSSSNLKTKLFGKETYSESSVDPRDVDALHTAIGKTISEGEATDVSFRLADDEKQWRRLRGARLPLHHGENHKVLCVISDITTLKAAEKNLSEQ